MKKREWKGKEEVIKTKDSVKRTPTGARNKALQSAFIRETARNTRQKSGSVFNEASDDSQEDMETDAVYVSEYAISKAKSRKTDKKKNGIFPCGKGKLFLGRKIIGYRLEQQMGHTEESNCRRQQHNGNDHSLWFGLFGVCRLGV